MNGKNMKLYKPSMMDYKVDEYVLPTIEKLALEYQVKLSKDTMS